MNFLLISSVLFFIAINSSICQESNNLVVVSVATKRTDGFKRYVRSLNVYGYSYEIFGLNEEWKGGDVKKYAGGGQKVNILVRELEKYKDDTNKILLFTDSYDVIIDDEPSVLIRKFKEFNARIVFGAEGFCWPDPKLADEYPQVDKNEKRFLNSGGIIGYASDFYTLITSGQLKDEDDDQLFYTNLFLNKDLRERLNMKLDTRSEIFQNLNGAIQDVYINQYGGLFKLFNNVTSTTPVVIHGNGAAKIGLNYIGNYIAEAQSTDGCRECDEDVIKLDTNEDNWPTVTFGIFIERPTPFLREFFEKIYNLKYPKTKISILLHNNVKYHTSEVAKFFEKYKNEYASIKYISPEEDSQEYEARAEAIEECKRNKCQYYFSIDSTAHLDNENTLKILIEQNRPILAPIMLRRYTQWSNFWGSISETGFYARSPNYVDIIEFKQVGVWNVPFINEAILMKSEFINNYQITFEDVQLDPDMMFAKTLRDQDAFLFATNLYEFGHLIYPDNFNMSSPRPEMYEIFSNYDDWAKRYISPDYYTTLAPEFKVEQPCPDVYWFPVVTEEFAESLIDMMETFGKWSGGKNYDPRLPGAYENVPTVDIHMNQVGWEKHWLYFLRRFIQPMQQKLFTGYYHDPPNALLNFVVRYRPSEQDHLKPHHDASTYTINIALNRPHIDFQGGGCRFVRYNCSVLDPRVGWTFIHPGRLTHYHEGLKVTNGTRYIMVSFIDP